MVNEAELPVATLVRIGTQLVANGRLVEDCKIPVNLELSLLSRVEARLAGELLP